MFNTIPTADNRFGTTFNKTKEEEPIKQFIIVNRRKSDWRVNLENFLNNGYRIGREEPGPYGYLLLTYEGDKEENKEEESK